MYMKQPRLYHNPSGESNIKAKTVRRVIGIGLRLKNNMPPVNHVRKPALIDL